MESRMGACTVERVPYHEISKWVDFALLNITVDPSEWLIRNANGMEKQLTDTILMIEPVAFGFNEETAQNNFFSNRTIHRKISFSKRR